MLRNQHMGRGHNRVTDGQHFTASQSNCYIAISITNLKSRIRETPTLWTDADSRTDTNLKRLHALSHFLTDPV